MGWFREQIRKGAFDECDMTDVIMCFNHNIDDILARTSSQTLTLSVDEVGLKFSFDAPNTTCGNDVVEWIRRGDVNKCSFRFVVGKDEWQYADENNSNEYDERSIVKISKLYDCALVVYPAYPPIQFAEPSITEGIPNDLKQYTEDILSETIKHSHSPIKRIIRTEISNNTEISETSDSLVNRDLQTGFFSEISDKVVEKPPSSVIAIRWIVIGVGCLLVLFLVNQLCI